MPSSILWIWLDQMFCRVLSYLWDKNEMSLELTVLENSCARYKTCYKSMSVPWNISRCSYVWKHWNPCGEVYWTLCSGQVGYVVWARFMGCRFDINTHLNKPAQLESIFICNSYLIIDYILIYLKFSMFIVHRSATKANKELHSPPTPYQR